MLCHAVQQGRVLPQPWLCFGDSRDAAVFCCSANYEVPESHLALFSEACFPGGEQVLQACGASPELLFHQHPRVCWSQGRIGNLHVVPCSPTCPLLPAILLAVASPAVCTCDREQIIPPQCLSFPCSVGTLTLVLLRWEDEKRPWSMDINMSSGISPLLADLVLAGFSERFWVLWNSPRKPLKITVFGCFLKPGGHLLVG